MAKKSMVNKNERRKATVAKYAAKRAELKELIRNPKTSDADRELAGIQLQKLPKDASPTRIRNRCGITGRPRGYVRKFGLSRIALREMAHRGELPGVTKSSW